MKNTAVNLFIEAIHAVRKQPKLLFLTVLFDIAFVFVASFLTTPVRDAMVERASSLALQLTSAVSPTRTPGGIVSVLFGPELREGWVNILSFMGIMFVLLYIAYVLFHGAAWWLSLKIANKNITYKEYLKGFAMINILWMFCYIIYKIVDLLAGLRASVIQTVTPGAGELLTDVLYILFILVAFAALFSYPLLKRDQLFKTPLALSLPVIIISSALFFGLRLINAWLSTINVPLSIVVGIITIFPAMAIIRVYIIKVITHVRS